ncbi:hypothetical protein L1987_72709 [Smallanthus sonchifolius]|uniref:Uncharacterized protein n=1 Tax=Smallanthus sonchifolius TaxID=185202 RepID=A0ACB9AV19_9ASTR|nr:hypothetical protein L1987_72709 [Smallanthus sonchifolius]
MPKYDLAERLSVLHPTTPAQALIHFTKQDQQNQLLEINNVLITHPDIFLQPSVAIHAVSGPFASFKLLPQINQLPICNNVNQTQRLDVIKIKAEWKMMVKFLTSSGFTPFAFWLYSVLDGIIKDHPNLHTMTIFAPPVIEIMEMGPSVVHQLLRYHIVPKKHSFKHLASFTGTVVNVSDELLSINQVEITSPNLLSSRSFVVHGIARAFAMDWAAS